MNARGWNHFSASCPKCIEPNSLQDFRECGQCVEKQVELVPESGVCPTCAQRYREGATECANQLCHDPSRAFDRAFAIAYQPLGSSLAHAIYNLKNRQPPLRANLAPLGCLLARHMGKHAGDRYDRYDIILPIPRSRAKVQEKGIDHVVELCVFVRDVLLTGSRASLGNKIQTSDPLWLQKTIELGGAAVNSPTLAARQALLAAVRSGQSENPYKVTHPAQVHGMRILLIDDIFTTGQHTLDLAARAVLGAGASQVDGLVVARQPWKY